MSITITDILSLLRKIIDICIVWVIFYFILKNIRNNIKLSLIFKDVVFVIVLSLIGNWLNFTTVSVLLDYIIQWGHAEEARNKSNDHVIGKDPADNA